MRGDFLGGIESGGHIRFPVFNDFLGVLDGELRLVAEQPGFLRQELSRFLAG